MKLRNFSLLFLVFTAPATPLASAPLSYQPSSATEIWNSSNAIWNQGVLPLIGWTSNSDALFQTGQVSQLSVNENLLVNSIHQTLAGTSLTIAGNSSDTLTLTGSGNVVSNTSGSSLTFASSSLIQLLPPSSNTDQIWQADTDSDIVVSGIISGGLSV